MTTPDYRALLQRLVNAIDAEPGDVPCLQGNLTAAYRAAFDALLVAPEASPPAAVSPTQLRPVDRYTLSDAILAAWHKHGNDSWCSIADEVIAALAAQPQAPSDEELLKTYKDETQKYWDSPDEEKTVLSEMVLRGLRAVLSRYGTAHPAPAPVGDVCYEFIVSDAETDEPQASGEASTLEEAQREGRHYLAMYGSGHRLELREVRTLPGDQP